MKNTSLYLTISNLILILCIYVRIQIKKIQIWVKKKHKLKYFQIENE